SRVTRSTTPATSATVIASPHSSATSRTTASRVVSPRWTRPPGRLHLPRAGGRPRLTSSTRSPWRTTAPTPTRGWSGYSRLTQGRRATPPWRTSPRRARRRAPDPRVTVQQVARAAADVVGGGGDAVGQLALGAVMVDRAPARGASHETDAEPPAGDGVDVAVEGLAVAKRDRRRRPREEAER